MEQLNFVREEVVPPMAENEMGTNGEDVTLEQMEQLMTILSSSEDGSTKLRNFFEHLLFLKGRRHVVFAFIVIVILAANLWALTTGALLSKLFRKPIKKYLGVSYSNIRVNPLRLRLSITNVEIHPCSSPLMRKIVLIVLPSADVRTEPPPSSSFSSSFSKPLHVRRSSSHGASHIPFRGSKVRIRSVSVSLSIRLWRFEPLKYVLERSQESRKEKEDAQPKPGDEEEGGNAEDAEVAMPSDEDAAENVKKEISQSRQTLRKFGSWCQRWLVVGGPAPKISVEVKSMRVEVDKAYLAPPKNIESRPSSPISESTDEGSFDHINSLKIPAAVVPQELLGSFVLPTFSEPYTASMMEIGTADNFTFFIEQWLAREKPRVKSTSRTAKSHKRRSNKIRRDSDVESSGLDSFLGTQDSFAGDDDKSFTSTTMKSDTSMATNDAQPEAESTVSNKKSQKDTLMLNSIRLILSSFTMSVSDFTFIVTGVDARRVTSIRKRYPPQRASLSIASVPRSERAITVIGVKKLSLSFEGDDCNAMLAYTGVFIRVGLPHLKDIFPKRNKASRRKMRGNDYNSLFDRSGENRSWHDVLSPCNSLIDISGMLHIAVWAIGYDHFWPKRELGVTYTAGETRLHLSADHVHTALIHFDEWIDANSPYNEWLNWVHEQHVRTCGLTMHEAALYQQLYEDMRIRKKQKKSKEKQNETNSEADDEESSAASAPLVISSDRKAIAAQLATLEERMTRREILLHRYIAMGDDWKTPRGSNELDAFLRSTESSVALNIGEERQRHASKQVRLEFQRTLLSDDENKDFFDIKKEYSSSFDALLSLLQEKYRLLTPHFTFSSRVESSIIEIQDHSTKDSHLNTVDLFKRNKSSMKKTTFEDVSIKKSFPSTMSVTQVSFEFQTRSVVFASSNFDQSLNHQVSILPYQNIHFSLDEVRWNPKGETSDNPMLPTFADGSPCGMLYQNPRKDPRPFLNLEFNSSAFAADPLDSHLDVILEITEVIAIVSPFTFASSIEVLKAVSNLPMRDLKSEDMKRQSTSDQSTEISSAANEDKTMIYEQEPSGTLLGGMNISIGFNLTNSSLLLLCDCCSIDKGVLKLGSTKIDASLSSNDEKETAKISINNVVASLCRVSGTNYDWGHVELHGLPFKDGLSLDGFQISYSAWTSLIQADGMVDANKRFHGKTSEGIQNDSAKKKISVRLTVFVGPNFVINFTPTFNTSLMACIESLKPVFGPSDDDLETKSEGHPVDEQFNDRTALRRKALRELWDDVDIDHNNTLDSDEVASVVKKLYYLSAYNGIMDGDIEKALKPTEAELRREVNLFLDIVDSNHDNEISFQEVEGALFQLNQFEEQEEIGTHSPGPEEGNDENANTMIVTGRHFAKDALFYGQSKGLIFFEDLREYSSTIESSRITGFGDLARFPPPSQWRNGKGTALFWELYQRETGCTRTSLNGQDPKTVQQKLVRTLCNYEFAKYCWKSLVRTSLQAVSKEDYYKHKRFATITTNWVLDSDPRVPVQLGLMNMLLQCVDKKGKQESTRFFLYDIKVLIEMDVATLTVGNTISVTKPLFCVEFSNMSMCASALINPSAKDNIFASFMENASNSKSRSIVDEAISAQKDKMSSDMKDVPTSAHSLHFELSIESRYLNTKHGTFETFVEPFSAFGDVLYHPHHKISVEKEDSAEGFSLSINFHCPGYINMHASPSILDTFNFVQMLLRQSSFEKFEELGIQRDVDSLLEFWHATYGDSSKKLDSVSINPILRMFYLSDRNIQRSMLDDSEIDELISQFIEVVDTDGDGLISFEEVEQAVRSRKIVSRSTFDSASEIRIWNRTGQDLKLCRQDVLDKATKQLSQFEALAKINTAFSILRHNTVKRVQLGKLFMAAGDQFDKMNKIALSFLNFKLVDNIPISAYQKVIIPLKSTKRWRRKRSCRRARNKYGTKSGFDPCVTIVPDTDSLDSIFLEIRSSFTVEAKTPIDIRIVRISQPLRSLQVKGSTDIDVTKKHLLFSLEQACEDAPVVFECNNVPIGSFTSIPLRVMISSCYHILLLRDTNEDQQAWRKPILLSKDFLHNPFNKSDVSLCHAKCGIVIQRDRLDVHNSGRGKRSARKSAWDTVIQAMPTFVMTNSLPFPIQYRCWQMLRTNDSDEFELSRVDLYTSISGSVHESSASDDDNEMSLWGSSKADPSGNIEKAPLKQHTQQKMLQNIFLAMDCISSGRDTRLNGIDMRQPLYIQVSQDVGKLGDHFDVEQHNKFASNLTWTTPIKIDLNKLQTGGNKKGSLSLPLITFQMGDEADLSIDVTLDLNGIPTCTLFSNYWVVNKTGMKMVFKITGKEDLMFDGGAGGYPILAKKPREKKREISAMPVESVSESIAKAWWDANIYGKLILKPPPLKLGGKKLVDWSQKVAVDAVGTVNEINCKGIYFVVSIRSLTGVFQKSNMISFLPRYIVKNQLSVPITILTASGIFNDVKKFVRGLKSERNSNRFVDKFVTLEYNQSTFLYTFEDISKYAVLEEKERFLCVSVDLDRYNYQEDWHQVPVDSIGKWYYIERDGRLDTISNIVVAEVKKNNASTIIHIKNCQRPPLRVENRSNEHYLQFVQDDDHAKIAELPPMTWCAYSWENPFGKKRLKCVAVARHKSKEYLVAITKNKKPSFIYSDSQSDSDSETDKGYEENKTVDEEASKNQSLKDKKESKDDYSNHTPSTFIKRKRLFSSKSRSYGLMKAGERKNLPCPSPKGLNTKSHLITEVRIIKGTRVLSFNDSQWRTKQMELGMLRSGGHWKNVFIDVGVEGIGLHLIDDFPHELCSVNLRELSVYKPNEEVETVIRLRHIQIDAMHKSAKYPNILQPLPLGVDRRDLPSNETVEYKNKSQNLSYESKKLGEQYWQKHNEKPLPVFETSISYLPQPHMIWIPDIDVFLCPMKVQIELDYLLRIIDLILNSLPDQDSTDDKAFEVINTKIETDGLNNENNLLSYVEHLVIHATWFELELDIRPEGDDEDGDDDDVEDQSMLALSAMGRTTKSALSASLITWVSNVSATFARISPTFKFNEVLIVDSYREPYAFLNEIATSYVYEAILQSYKILFSMNLLGNPTQLVEQYKTGVIDLASHTRDEVMAGGKKGFGKGVASLVQNVVGGTFSAVGKITGNMAEVVSSAAANEMTVSTFKSKPQQLTHSPKSLGEGIVQATTFLDRTLAHGIVGLVGNPYRGIKQKSSVAFMRGVASGLSGLVAAPLVGALGFTAKISEGISGTTQMLEARVIESRCRPARIAGWGCSIGNVGLPYLKAVGIRIHVVRYQKKTYYQSVQNLGREVNTKDFKRAKVEQRKMKNPTSKVFSVTRMKDKQLHLSRATKPKLLIDEFIEGKNSVGKTCQYSTTFEDTIILRCGDLQLTDVIVFHLWNKKSLYPSSKNKPLAQCTLTMADIYSSLRKFYEEQQFQRRRDLSRRIGLRSTYKKSVNKALSAACTNQMVSEMRTMRLISGQDGFFDEQDPEETMLTPLIQEIALVVPPPRRQRKRHENLADVINSELTSIMVTADDAYDFFDSDSSYSAESIESTFFLGKGRNDEGKQSPEKKKQKVQSMEELFGHVYLSFFPIPW